MILYEDELSSIKNPLNANALISNLLELSSVSRVSANVKDVNDVHPEKAERPMTRSDAGRCTERRSEHPANALSPMVVNTLSGSKVMDRKAGNPLELNGVMALITVSLKTANIKAGIAKTAEALSVIAWDAESQNK